MGCPTVPGAAMRKMSWPSPLPAPSDMIDYHKKSKELHSNTIFNVTNDPKGAKTGLVESLGTSTTFHLFKFG